MSAGGLGEDGGARAAPGRSSSIPGAAGRASLSDPELDPPPRDPLPRGAGRGAGRTVLRAREGVRGASGLWGGRGAAGGGCACA